MISFGNKSDGNGPTEVWELPNSIGNGGRKWPGTKGILLNEELLEVISEENVEESPVAEISESDPLLTALKQHAGVEAQLQDLTEFIDTIHEATKRLRNREVR